MRIGIVAAMPGEVAPLARAAGLKQVAKGCVTVLESDQYVVAFAGMGRERALDACRAVSERGPVSQLISYGWVGALRSGLPAMSVWRPALVIDAETGERFTVSDAQDGPTLVTVSRIAGAAAKEALLRQWQADLVDMEAAHVARFAREHGIPFGCLRAVSDAHDAKLPDMNAFNTADGQFQIARFVRWLALRPWWWPAVVRMGKHASASARTLSLEVRSTKYEM
jgi:adenosylhomocysteine nucleosidase